jgi:hypothetical protein
MSICDICAKDPLAHSFKKVTEKRGIAVFSTKPSQAKCYDDTQGILNHVDKAITAHGKKWMCIIDGDNFDAKYTLEYKTGMGLMDLFFNKHMDTLIEVKVINPTIYIRTVMKFLLQFIGEDKLSKITVLDDKPYSILQFM